MATADFLVVPQGLPDPALSLDALSADAASFAAMFDGGRLDESLDLEGLDGVVIVDRVHVEAEMRGRGLGPLLVAEALHRLGRDCAAAACDDSPLGTSDCADRSAIRRMIRDFGFGEWRDGLWILDLATTGLEATRQSIHEARLRSVD